MLSRKRVAQLRVLAFFVTLALVIAIFFAVSAMANSRHMKYMGMPTLNGQSTYRTSSVDASDTKNWTDMDPLADDANFAKVAENDYLILYTHNGYKGIKLYDKRTAQTWCSYIEDESLVSQAQGLPREMMSAFFTFKYMELHTQITATSVINGSSSKYAPATKNPEDTENYVSSKKVPGGVCWTFDMKDISIKLDINILLDDDALIVEVPDKNIVERQDALEAIAQSKKTLEADLETIRKQLDGVISAAKSSSGKDSFKNAVESNLQAAIKSLTNLKNTVGTSKFNIKDAETVTDKVKIISKSVKAIIPEQADVLSDILKKMGGITDSAAALSQNIPHGLVELQLMPAFGAQPKTSEGYVFYPDGSGAISYFNVQHPSQAGQFSGAVYGDYASMVGVGNTANTGAVVRSVEMPVYGIKLNNSAFLAILTKGDTDSVISYLPITDVQPVASAYNSFLMRKSTSMVNANGSHTLLYDTHRTAQDLETRYTFLSEENADYSGMARTYRHYLKDTGKLIKSKLLEAEKMPLGLEFFMGTNSEQQTLFTSYITMTRFNDVLDTVKRLEKDGLGNLLVSMYGWQQDYNLMAMPGLNAASQLGGESDLKDLAAYMRSKGYLLSIDKSMTWVDEDNLSSAQSSVAAIKAKSQMIRSWMNMQPMNPVYVYNTFLQRDIDFFKEMGVNAAALYEIDALHYDYNENAPVDRGDTAQIFAGITEQVQKQIGYSVMNQVPQYLLSTTDWTMYVAEDDSNYLYADADVPFYQIVVHGNIMYTGEGFNYMYNTSQQNLKYIEYGYVPFYMLTKEEPYELRMTGLKHNFYSTVIDDWYDRIVDTYNQYSTDFADVWNVEMVSHQRLSDTVSCTTYSNGVRVYVNYALTEQTVDGVTIGAESYQVVR